MEDWQRRFIDEYNALKDKYKKLHKMIIKYEAGTLNFEPKCSIEVLKNQKCAMGSVFILARSSIRNRRNRISLIVNKLTIKNHVLSHDIKLGK